MLNEERKQKLEDLKKAALSIKEYQAAVINIALDSIVDDLYSKLVKVSGIKVSNEKLIELNTRKIRLQFWEDFSCYEFVQPSRLCRPASQRDESCEIKECLKFGGVPSAKLRVEKEETLMAGKNMIGLNDGCYYEFSKSEKERAIKYMKDNNIPLNLLLFKDVLNLVFYGIINIEEEKENVK